MEALAGWGILLNLASFSYVEWGFLDNFHDFIFKIPWFLVEYLFCLTCCSVLSNFSFASEPFRGPSSKDLLDRENTVFTYKTFKHIFNSHLTSNFLMWHKVLSVLQNFAIGYSRKDLLEMQLYREKGRQRRASLPPAAADGPSQEPGPGLGHSPLSSVHWQAAGPEPKQLHLQCHNGSPRFTF